MKNVDTAVAAGFGREWSSFSQGEQELSASERQKLFDDYFHIFPWDHLPDGAVGIDVGCGSGRWSMMVAPRVGSLHLLDASAEALEVAKRNLVGVENVSFHHASVGDIPIENASLDFAFSLGVLHHVPDTTSAIRSVASKLKSGAPFLIYLYYSLDNRPWWFRLIWQVSNAGRLVISRLPTAFRMLASQIIAVTVYWPFARFAAVVQRIGLPTSLIPLEAYKNLSFYTMRTDAYDRFCTALEKRFSKAEIATMLTDAGFERVSFSETVPYWCAVGYKR